MDLETRKIELIQEFLKIKNEEVISQFENLLKRNKNVDANDTLSPISIEEFNNRIDKSEYDFRNGRYRMSSELLEKFR